MPGSFTLSSTTSLKSPTFVPSFAAPMKVLTPSALFSGPLMWGLYGMMLVLFAGFWGFDGLYGQDAYEYYRCYCELGNNKMCHFPIQYPLWAKSLGLFFSAKKALQLWGIFAAAAALFYVEKFLRLFSSNTTQIRLFVFTFGASSLYFSRLGLCIMSDTTAIFFSIAGAFHVYRYLEKAGKSSDLIWGLLFLLNAALTRYAAVLLVLLPSLLGLYAAVKRRDGRALLLSFLTGAVFIALAFWLKNNYFSAAEQHALLTHWDWRHIWGQQFTNTGDGSGAYVRPNLIFYLLFFLHPAYIAWGALFLLASFFTFRHISRTQLLVLFLPASCYWLFLAGSYHQGIRLLLLIFPHLLLFYFPAFEWIHQKSQAYVSQKGFLFLLLLTCVAQWAVFPFATQKMRQWNRVETQLAQSLKRQLPPNATIYTLGMEGVLFANELPQQTISLYGDSLKNIEKEAFILIQTAVFKKQWASLLPERNLQFLQKQSNFVLKDSFELGWHLYECRPSAE